MRIKLIGIALLCISISSCLLKEEQNAASEIANMFGAKSYSVKSESNYTSSEGGHQVLILTLTDPQNDGTEFSSEKIASASALLLIQNIDSSRGYDRFEIDVVNGSTQYNQTFEVKELKKDTGMIFPFVKTFLAKMKTRDFTFLGDLIENGLISDSAMAGVEKLLMHVDSTHGKAMKITLTGFKSYTLEQLNNREALGVWFEVENEKGHTWFRVFIAKDNNKMLGFKFNDTRPIE